MGCHQEAGKARPRWGLPSREMTSKLGAADMSQRLQCFTKREVVEASGRGEIDHLTRPASNWAMFSVVVVMLGGVVEGSGEVDIGCVDTVLLYVRPADHPGEPSCAAALAMGGPYPIVCAQGVGRDPGGVLLTNKNHTVVMTVALPRD